MECAQIEVTGGSGTASPELVSIPGVYPVSSRCPHALEPMTSIGTDGAIFLQPNDPGIVIDIYNGLGNGYPTPGMFKCLLRAPIRWLTR